MEFAIWLVGGLVIGGGIGAVATWWISRARGGAVSVMQLKQENEKFRNEVTEHFVETARLINQMTDSYKQVFDHLSSGAEKLVDNHKLAERLPPSSGQEVKLSDFGAPGSTGSRAASSSRGTNQAGDRSGGRSGGRSGSRDGAGGDSSGDSGRQQSSGSGESAKSGPAGAGYADPLKNRPGRGGPGSPGSGEQQGGKQSGSTSQAGDRPSRAGKASTRESTSSQASDKSRSSD